MNEQQKFLQKILRSDMLIFYYSFTKQMTPHIPWVMICLGKRESQEKCPRKCLSGLISFIVKGSRQSLQKSGTLRVSWNSTFSLKINDHDGTIFFIFLFYFEVCLEFCCTSCHFLTPGWCLSSAHLSLLPVNLLRV